ncbi:hypothetical protein FOMPIDRAFT_117071 [Fomitopsis schrenkii]|uniref:Uncharacterized protein n=1 Tax=Fomitopsis schrenkii TaxID=2126942 RepID=S8DWB5_FOMSC|nr:hypothetical protein FOMPIDRAFT_117071 [Fomitopsis schrenkii]
MFNSPTPVCSIIWLREEQPVECVNNGTTRLIFPSSGTYPGPLGTQTTIYFTSESKTSFYGLSSPTSTTWSESITVVTTVITTAYPDTFSTSLSQTPQPTTTINPPASHTTLHLTVIIITMTIIFSMSLVGAIIYVWRKQRKEHSSDSTIDDKAEEQNDTVASSNAHELDREARVHPVRDCYFLLMVQQLADGTHTAQAGIFSDNVLHLPASDYRRQIGEHSRQPEQLRWGGIGGFGVHRARDGRDRGHLQRGCRKPSRGALPCGAITNHRRVALPDSLCF